MQVSFLSACRIGLIGLDEQAREYLDELLEFFPVLRVRALRHARNLGRDR
jgi:hypothetical protein